jgi:hypothetical protein
LSQITYANNCFNKITHDSLLLLPCGIAWHGSIIYSFYCLRTRVNPRFCNFKP